MNNVTYIYALVDPRDQQIFYVGKTSVSLEFRLRSHLNKRKLSKTSKDERVCELVEAGLKPSIIELSRLEDASFEEWSAVEQAWIDFYRLSNPDLTNRGTGGQGGDSSSRALRKQWTSEMDALLGTEPDKLLAERFGCSRKTVGNRRQLLGISPCPPRLKQLPNGANALMGKVPDYVLAQRYQVTPKLVQSRRQGLGIAPHPNGFKLGQVSPRRKELPQWVIEKMGTMPDLELAKLAGVSQWAISWRRNVLGILSYAEQVGKPCKKAGGDV